MKHAMYAVKHSIGITVLFVVLMIGLVISAQAQTCQTDADCTDPLFPRCNLTTEMCEVISQACLTDADCLDPNFPSCNFATNMCEATPVAEGCDNESGAGYGLCNAYCEAMNCDGDEPNASDKACTKVLDNFRRIVGYEMPLCKQ